MAKLFPYLSPRRVRSGVLLSSLLVLSGIAACGDSGTDTPINTDCADFGEVGETASCPQLCPITNDAFCAGDADTIACDDLAPVSKVEMCGVGLPAPPDAPIELERSANVKEFGGTGAPVLGCFTEAGYPAKPSTSMPVTMQGIAKIFSNGCDSADLEVSIYTVIRGGPDDGMPGDLIGTSIITDADCSINGVPETVDDCPESTRHECRFEYPMVPSETELLIITDGSKWAPIYEYNVFIPNDEVVNGVYEKDIRALAQDDYGIIAQVALGSNISPGNGVIAGEVHDCDNVRLQNAVVEVNAPRLITTYFTDNEDDPLPDLSARSTSPLGLYAAMDMEPGPVTVAAAGIHEGQLMGVGFFRARVFADAVTSITFRGLQPFQVP